MISAHDWTVAGSIAFGGWFLFYGFSLLFPRKSNSKFTSKSTIVNQMNEPRPLPMGVKEFTEWSDRIISGALIPTENKESLRAALAVMLQALGPQEDHKPDAYFIHSLRKAATNQVAQHFFSQAHAQAKAKPEATASC